MSIKQKQAIVLHSGGFDSTLTLALAAKEFPASDLLSLSFQYGQRHVKELEQAEKLSRIWQVDHACLSIDFLQQITSSALIGQALQIADKWEEHANTLVIGRNGLMARLGAIYAEHVGASYVYMGVMQEEAKQMGYRDCSREYMNLKQQILRLDLGNPSFEIRTPLVHLTKLEAMELAYKEGILELLLRETHSCYENVPSRGCMRCPTCKSRNAALDAFLARHPEIVFEFFTTEITERSLN